jgi:uncharacterized membrane protein YbaN (DUF454 family)
MARLFFLFLVAVCFLLACVGIVIPGPPTTPFLLLTSYFLVRSFPQLNSRLLKSRFFGPILTDWQVLGLRSSCGSWRRMITKILFSLKEGCRQLVAIATPSKAKAGSPANARNSARPRILDVLQITL